MLEREKIDTAEQLLSFKARCENEIVTLTAERSKIKSEGRSNTQCQGIYQVKGNPRHQEINNFLKSLRKQVRQCNRIVQRFNGMPERVNLIERDEEKKLQPTRRAKSTDSRNRNHRER